MDPSSGRVHDGGVSADDRGNEQGDRAAVPGVQPGTSGPGRARAGETTTRRRDGRDWLIGTEADVAWIAEGTAGVGLSIATAIPPVFEAYATIVVPDRDEGRAADLELLVQTLRRSSVDQDWWLGFLETGADDLVFPDAPRVRLYADWPYVLVKAGPEQALAWRTDPFSWHAPGPDLMFPADRSWLVSWLWDDDWRCVGGPAALVDDLLAQPALEVRQVVVDEDATPPGHVAR